MVMIKILLLIGSIFFLNGLFGQAPSIIGTYLPVVNTEIKQVWIHSGVNNGPLASSLDAPEYGDSVTWDYSSSLPASIETGSDRNTHTLKTVPTNTFPGNDNGSNFTEATHASHWTSPIGGFDSVWTYSVVDTSGMHTVGIVSIANVGGFNVPIEIDVQELSGGITGKDLVIPFTVGENTLVKDSLLRVTTFSNGIPSGVPGAPQTFPTPTVIHQRVYKTLEEKGWGTLKTPLGTFTDVLLGRSLEIDTTFYIKDTNGDGIYEDTIHTSTSNASRYKHFFLRNNTFATSLLMELDTDVEITSNQTVLYAWYTLPSEVGNINGTVYDSHGGTINSGSVLLYREHGNFTKDDVLDSSIIGNGGIYDFEKIPFGKYRLLVKPDLTQYPTAYSTYYEETPNAQDSLQGTSWPSCDLVTTTGDISGIDIVVRHTNFSPSTIPNQLNGTLMGYAVTKIGGDDPIEGIDIIIKKNPGSKPVIFTQTNEFGEFSFDNIPDGTYKLWVDMPGLNLDDVATYHFEILNGQYNRCEFDFKANLDSLERTGQDVACAWTLLIEQEKEEILKVSPNPFEYSTNLILNLIENTTVSIAVYDITGKMVQNLVSNSTLSGVQSFDLNAIKKSGVYFVKATVGEETISKRLIKL